MFSSWSFGQSYQLCALSKMDAKIPLMKEVADQFMADHNDEFCGIKLIYAPPRFALTTTIEQNLDKALQLKSLMPDFVLGFDLIGQEDKGKPLIDFIEPILEKTADQDLKFFFHAGETDWQGQTTDSNIIDAILLNTTRIGHGYAIAKHPEAMKLAMEQDIPIEVCPISNQVNHT